LLSSNMCESHSLFSLPAHSVNVFALLSAEGDYVGSPFFQAKLR